VGKRCAALALPLVLTSCFTMALWGFDLADEVDPATGNEETTFDYDEGTEWSWGLFFGRLGLTRPGHPRACGEQHDAHENDDRSLERIQGAAEHAQRADRQEDAREVKPHGALGPIVEGPQAPVIFMMPPERLHYVAPGSTHLRVPRGR